MHNQTAPAIAAILTLSATPALADVSVSIYGGQQSYTVPALNEDVGPGETSGAGPQSIGYTYAGHGSATAYADYGVLKVASTYAMTGAPVPGYSNLSGYLGGNASFTDAVSLAGFPASGTYTVKIIVDGTLDTNGSAFPNYGGTGFANASVRLDASNGGSSFNWIARANASNAGLGNYVNSSVQGQPGSMFGTFFIDVPFADSSQLLDLKLSIACSASGKTIYTANTAGGSCAMDHSVYWGGVTAVHDAQGNLVTGYSLTSVSGFDYAMASPLAPVPEPGEWAMMAAGLAIVGSIARRRRNA